MEKQTVLMQVVIMSLVIKMMLCLKEGSILRQNAGVVFKQETKNLHLKSDQIELIVAIPYNLFKPTSTKFELVQVMLNIQEEMGLFEIKVMNG